jgi:SSS family solute:Na+ symporter
MGAVFVGLIILQLVLGTFMKRSEAYVQVDAKAVDLTPWSLAKPVGGLLIAAVLILYLALAG